MTSYIKLSSKKKFMIYTCMRHPPRDVVNRELAFFLVVNRELGYGRDRDRFYGRES